MTDEKKTELALATQRLANDMMSLTIHLSPRFRDVQIGANSLGYRESLYIWGRYVALPFPSTVLRSVSNILRFISTAGVTCLASVVGIALSIAQVALIVPLQTLFALIGRLRIHYTEETVRECFLESICKMDSYKAFIEVGGQFNKDTIVLTTGFVKRVEEAIHKTNGGEA